MRKCIQSMWFRLLVGVVCSVLFVAVPGIIVRATHSNGVGAGVFVIAMVCGLPLSSLLCGFLSAPDPRKLWFMPLLPSLVYFLFFPFLTDANLPYLLAQFSGLLLGLGAFALGIYILKNRRK